MDLAMKNQRLRLGEVIPYLPPGIELDREKHPNLNTSIVKLKEIEDDKLAEGTIKLMDGPKYRQQAGIRVTMEEKYGAASRDIGVKKEEDADELGRNANPVPDAPLGHVKKKNVIKKVHIKSLKDKIKQLGLEINPEMAQMDDKKKR